MEKDWYSPQELADILSLKVDTIREYIRKKQLPAYRFGRDYRVKKVDYEKWVEKRRTTTNTDES